MSKVGINGHIKIAVSLPRELYKKLEEARKATGESRSAIIKKAIEEGFKRRKEAELTKRYTEGYISIPERKEEMDIVESNAIKALSHEPWE